LPLEDELPVEDELPREDERGVAAAQGF